MSHPKISFGSLEKSIMVVLWKHGRQTVRQVLDQLPPHSDCAYTTVMTVMNRLAKQGVLRRRLGSHGAYHYDPIHNRDSFCAQASRYTVDQLVAQYGDIALAQFINRLDRVPAEKLNRLRRRVQSPQK